MSKELIGIAVDHGGFTLKQSVPDAIRAAGFDVLDLGTDSEDSVVYPASAHKLVERMRAHKVSRAELICGERIRNAMSNETMNS